MRKTTLCYIVRDGKVLLAMKKRGFGAGKWNGPGGKVQNGESPGAACQREVLEETGLRVETVERRGVITFKFPARPDWDQECHIFVAHGVSGEPIESEEMRPTWFELDQIPLADMWEDDAHWLPNVLHGGEVQATSIHDAEGRLIDWRDMRGDVSPA